jgi:RNA 2',3'-cyclic 3'-phosphodiesterase
MRAFLGISVPKEMKTSIISAQNKFSGFDIKFVEPENLHFNLRFFGEINEEDAGKVKTLLGEALRNLRPFEIKIAGMGAFPNKDYIRVVWIGVKDGHQEIVSLAEAVQGSIQSLGFEAEEKFVPHLTLGRVRSGRNKEELSKLLDKTVDLEIGTMKVDEVKMFQSKLGPNRPIYEEVFSVKIGTR